MASTMLVLLLAVVWLVSACYPHSPSCCSSMVENLCDISA